MLGNLSEAIETTRERIATISLDDAFTPSAELWSEIIHSYAGFNSDTIKVVNNSFVLVTPENKFLTISAQEIPRFWAVIPYARALTPYRPLPNALANSIGFATPRSGRAKEEIFKKIPHTDWETKLTADDVSKIKTSVATELDLSANDQSYFLTFLSNKDWSGLTKTLERGELDWFDSAIVNIGGWLSNASDRRGAIVRALLESDKFEPLMANAITAFEKKQNSTPAHTVGKPAEMGINKIFYGAPGTGKSHSVDGLLGDISDEFAVRTVFHPDTQNSDFFGCLKPKMVNGGVQYGFAPGPFSTALRKAYLDPDHHYFLVIEELNRAPAAAVFGELFQLLDRDAFSGKGKYRVDYPNEESREKNRLCKL